MDATEPSTGLSPAFWSDFVRRYWNRKAVVFRDPPIRDFPTAAECLEAIVSASDELRKGRDVPLRLFLEHRIEGASVERRYFASRVEFPQDHLPTGKDRSVDAYMRRASRRFDGKRFGLVINNIPAYHFRHWLQMVGFAEGLHAAIGVPMGGMDSGIFLGTYRHTPFGIHKDGLHAFTFVVEGTKTMLAWPLDTFTRRSHPEVPQSPEHRALSITIRDRAEHRELMRTAVRLEGKPGDVFYWPPSYWHCSEPAPGPTLTIALAVRPTGLGFLPPSGTPADMEPSPWIRPAEALPGKKAYRVPGPVLEALRKKRPEFSRGPGRVTATRSWMSFATSFGFHTPAAPDPGATLKRVRAVRGHPRRPVAWTRVGSGRLLVACNGWTQEILAHPRLIRLIEAFNSGTPVPLSKSVREFSGRVTKKGVVYDVDRAYVLKFIGILLRWRAVSPCRADPGDSRKVSK